MHRLSNEGNHRVRGSATMVTLPPETSLSVSYHQSNACVADVWVLLTSGSHLSVTVLY